MVLSIIFLEDKHKILLHLSILYEYQQFFQHSICFSIQPPDYSDPWPRLADPSSFFLIRLLNQSLIVLHLMYHVKPADIIISLELLITFHHQRWSSWKKNMTHIFRNKLKWHKFYIVVGLVNESTASNRCTHGALACYWPPFFMLNYIYGQTRCTWYNIMW